MSRARQQRMQQQEQLMPPTSSGIYCLAMLQQLDVFGTNTSADTIFHKEVCTVEW